MRSWIELHHADRVGDGFSEMCFSAVSVDICRLWGREGAAGGPCCWWGSPLVAQAECARGAGGIGVGAGSEWIN